MYKVKIIKSFSSAHYLAQYKGSCESLHGHNWKVEVVVQSEELNDLGMVMDFRQLKKITVSIIEKLDHKCLNDLEYFKINTPSSEKIAQYIYEKVSQKLPQDCQLDEVKVWETDNSCATYSKKK
ncbi:MAG: 6-carboxytetrahydropterin synthase QueD [Candidatus Omnitrophica bacterium]|nr:6-carboxytetrahydropterin synthase QueD [Candidatus Omnitrophota bacterium]MCF7893904.1 6-carboxytetrahydropterin synthase QueD [Candidatus Omnitrophota bacterium]